MNTVKLKIGLLIFLMRMIQGNW